VGKEKILRDIPKFKQTNQINTAPPPWMASVVPSQGAYSKLVVNNTHLVAVIKSASSTLYICSRFYALSDSSVRVK
jgi:amino acid permease